MSGCTVRFAAYTQNIVVPARADYYRVEIWNYYTATYTAVLGTAGGQTITISDWLHIEADGNNAIIVDAATHNPDVNVGGNLDYTGTGAGSEDIHFGNGKWTVGGTIDLRGGTCTAGNSEIVMDGAGESLYGNSLTLYDLTHEANCTIQEDVTLHKWKCITPSTVITHIDGITVAFYDFEFDGQASGTKIVLQRSASSDHYYYDCTGPGQTDISYVNVSWCDASAGTAMDASNGTNNDGGNNVNWKFLSASAVPLIRLSRPWLGPARMVG